MNLELRSLIYKQWRERRLALVLSCGWMFCCLVYVVGYECAHRLRDPVAGFSTSSMIYLLFAGIYLAMKTALGEKTSGAIGFSRALPVERRHLGWVRLAGSILTLVAPVLLGALIMTPFLWSGFLEQVPTRMPNNVDYISMLERPALSEAAAVRLLWTVSAIVLATWVQFFLLLSILGTRLRSEAQVGFFGAVLAFIWTITTSFQAEYESLNSWFGAIFPSSFMVSWGYSSEGTGSYTDLEIFQPLWEPLAANLLLQVFLCWVFLCWYGKRIEARESQSSFRWRRWPAIWSRVPLPLPSRLTSLVWINLRQSLPLAISGLMLAALLAFAQMSDNMPEQDLRTHLPSSTWIVAMVWATVVGAGVFSSELRPGLASFWRSRPLTVRSWFWCKFIVGLIAVLAVLDGATIWVSWGTPVDYTSGLSKAYIACMPIIHATLYSVAVLGVCWMRRPALGGMLAIGVYFVVTVLLETVYGYQYEPINIHNHLIGDELRGQFDLSAHNYPLVFGSLVALSVVSAWLASRAIRPAERRSMLLLRPVAPRFRLPVGTNAEPS